MDAKLNPTGQAFSLLSGPWDHELAKLLTTPKDFLLIASPFITSRAMLWVGECMSKNEFSQRVNILCLTNLKVESVLSGSLELDGLTQFGLRFPNFAVSHLPSLHAKVFVADDLHAIVTSGNLTDGGLRKNCEYGVSIRTPRLVKGVRKDFEEYAQLGAPVTMAELNGLSEELAGLRRIYQTQNRRFIKDARGRFKGKLQTAEDQVLQFRARSNSNQGIFRKTILYLLAKSPLKTAELNPMIQQIHPDICDDSVDRVIDGVNFGKKWKHHVRSAQQALK